MSISTRASVTTGPRSGVPGHASSARRSGSRDPRRRPTVQGRRFAKHHRRPHPGELAEAHSFMSLSHTPSSPKAELAGTAVIDGREWFEMALSCIGDGVIAADREGRVNYLNPIAEKLIRVDARRRSRRRDRRRSFASSMRRRGKPVQQPVRELGRVRGAVRPARCRGPARSLLRWRSRGDGPLR